MEAKRCAVQTLVSNLSSVSERTRLNALCELRIMSMKDPETRPVISEAGTIPYLVETLYSSSHPAQQNAASTLRNLSLTEKETIMSTRGVLDALAHVISHHSSTSSAAAVQASAATIHRLLSRVDDYRTVVGSKREIVYALIDILRCHHSSPPRTVKNALKALCAIALHPLNRAAMVQFGIVPDLFSLVVNDSRAGILEDATAVIAQVACCDESVEAFRKVSGIKLLTDLLHFPNDFSKRTRENAVCALLNLVRCGGDAVAGNVRKYFFNFDGIVDVIDYGIPKMEKMATELLQVLLDESRFSKSWQTN